MDHSKFRDHHQQKRHIASYPKCPKYREKSPAWMYTTQTVIDDHSWRWFFDIVLPWVETEVLKEYFQGFCSFDGGGKKGYDCSENRRLTA
jgi:hypothetical protein